MEAFSLLKYWRPNSSIPGNAVVSVPGDTVTKKRTTSAAVTTIVTAVSHHNISDSEDEENNSDDGPFFDLEFAAVEGEDNNEGCVEENDKNDKENDCSDSEESGGEDEGEVKFTTSPFSSGDSIDANVSLSPSDDLFFKGKLVPLSEPNCKPVSLLKSATKSTKFGVMMLKLKKSSKANATERVEPEESQNNNKETTTKKQQRGNKLFTVKLKVEEVPIVSLFTRDYSSKGAAANKCNKEEGSDKISQEERGFSKEVLMNKYLKKVKPLYVRVSKRYGEKLGLSGGGGEAQPEVEKSATDSPKVSQVLLQRNERRGSLPAVGLGVVKKHLGKGRSATVAAAASPPGPVVSRRRDDSLLQQQDGIQSAIMHCKRSFKASRDLEASGELGSTGDESQGEKSGIESQSK